jgi:nicotinamide-nucleotide amidase
MPGGFGAGIASGFEKPPVKAEVEDGMNAEIIAVGNELLLGRISNDNAAYISGRLSEAGLKVNFHTAVGDDPGHLGEVLKTALGRSDVLVLTGGLGPTEDDLTGETVAVALGRKFVLHEKTLALIKKRYARMHRYMDGRNLKQAHVPEGATVLENSRGTAPGCIIEWKGRLVVLLPGPPSEMKPMFDKAVLPRLLKESSWEVKTVDLKIFGLGESLVEEKVSEFTGMGKNPSVATYVQEGEVTLRITARFGRGGKPDSILSPILKPVMRRLGRCVFSTQGETLPEAVGRLLIKKEISISVAESCTGGMLSEYLTGVPGISSVFSLGIVAYGNDMKIKLLGVGSGTLEKHGALSARTAEEMAAGIRKKARSDIGISITGIAGPGGGTPGKPVGLAFIGFSDGDGTFSRELNLIGDRRKIRRLCCLHALDIVRRRIAGA